MLRTMAGANINCIENSEREHFDRQRQNTVIVGAHFPLCALTCKLDASSKSIHTTSAYSDSFIGSKECFSRISWQVARHATRSKTSMRSQNSHEWVVRVGCRCSSVVGKKNNPKEKKKTLESRKYSSWITSHKSSYKIVYAPRNERGLLRKN